jgi:hypothetical protein
VIIDDPKMYTKPWVAVNKFPFRVATAQYPSGGKCVEQRRYNETVGNQVNGTGAKTESH